MVRLRRCFFFGESAPEFPVISPPPPPPLSALSMVLPIEETDRRPPPPLSSASVIEESVLPDGEGQLREVVRPSGSVDDVVPDFFDVAAAAAVVSWSKSNAESGCKVLLLLFLPVCFADIEASTSSA